MADTSYVSRIDQERQTHTSLSDNVIQDMLHNLDVLTALESLSVEHSFIPDSKHSVMIRVEKYPVFLQVRTYATRVKDGQICVAFSVEPEPDIPHQPLARKAIETTLSEIEKSIQHTLNHPAFQPFDNAYCVGLNSAILQNVKDAGIFAPEKFYDPAHPSHQIKHPEMEKRKMGEILSNLYHPSADYTNDEGHQVRFNMVHAPMERDQETALTTVVKSITKRDGDLPYGACWVEGAENTLTEIIDNSLPEHKIGYSLNRSDNQATLAISGSEKSLDALRTALQKGLQRAQSFKIAA